jgi:hypothetical protein
VGLRRVDRRHPGDWFDALRDKETVEEILVAGDTCGRTAEASPPLRRIMP